MPDNLKYYVGFSYFLGIGPHKFNKLIEHFGSIDKAYNAKKSELSELIGTITSEKFDIFRNNFSADSVIDSLSKKNIQILPINSRDYPNQLAQISDPPICLYLKGSLQTLKNDYKNNIAIVGTRCPTPYGISIANKISSEIAQNNLLIISGLALGIDTIAHQQAVSNKKPTVAVLGCGVDIVYPALNRELYHKIIENNGCIISEFPPAQVVMKGLFIARNRVISGLSKGIVVIEGTKDSGSLITAKYGNDQGREIYAVPGPINSSLSQAPNILLKQGAKMVTTTLDILEDYDIKTTKKSKDYSHLSPIQADIVKILLEESLNIDEILKKTKMDIQQLGQEITTLELNGEISKNTSNKYEVLS